MPRISITRTTLTDYLGDLADRLRADALALDGYQATYSADGSRELDALSQSLQRTAGILEGLGEVLCKDCRMAGLIEEVRSELPATRTRSPSRSS